MTTDSLHDKMYETAAALRENGYIFECYRLQGFADALCLKDKEDPKDGLLASYYMLGKQLGGNFFTRLSLPTLLKYPSLR